MSLIHTDQRFLALCNWLQNDLSIHFEQLTPASTDASFRRYFRLKQAHSSYIAMDAPPDKENSAAFVRVAGLMQEAGIHVPHIHQKNLEQGFLLLEDLGNDNLLSQLNAESADGFYRNALDLIIQLQTRINTAHCTLPIYDEAFLERELNIFQDWFLDKLVGIVMPSTIKLDLHQLLIDSALQQPQCCVHRDFHSRNLMVQSDNSLAVIDFQDAVIGPLCYDAVSLLRDCYINWPAEQLEQWQQYYYQQLLASHLLDTDFAQFLRWFDLMGLQRHLKAIGIFSRLHLRDNKPGYLADIPRTLAYVNSIASRYTELQEFNAFLQHQVIPSYRNL
jgi:N-acetylmuramate 1-kinase